jgi:hypothetical protein
MDNMGDEEKNEAIEGRNASTAHHKRAQAE